MCLGDNQPLVLQQDNYVSQLNKDALPEENAHKMDSRVKRLGIENDVSNYTFKNNDVAS